MKQLPYEIPMNKIEIYGKIQLRDRSFNWLDNFIKHPIEIWEWFMDYVNGQSYLIIAIPYDNTDNIKYQYISKKWRKPKSILLNDQ